MTTIQFYHLLSTPLERALPALMSKALSAGLRCAVLSNNESTLKRLDDALWEVDAASFIPHGTSHSPAPQREPVYLSLTEETPNGATLLAVTDGTTPRFMDNYARVLDIFDGHDLEAVAAARKRWKHYQDSGYSLSYIQQQENGGWHLKSQTAATTG